MNRQLLIALVKAATVIGLVFVAFGANYTNLLIYLMLGPTWGATAAPTVLAWYCLYVLTMGINGITEGVPRRERARERAGVERAGREGKGPEGKGWEGASRDGQARARARAGRDG